MAKNYEGHFKGFDGTELFFQSWQKKNAKATIILVHGLGEHSGSYQRYAEEQAKHGWDIFACDLRGHGRSEGQRGYVYCIDEFEKDVFNFIKVVKKDKIETENFVLMGHSMGGLVASKCVIAYGDQGMKALSLSAPAWGLSVEAPEWKKKAAHYIKQYLPRLTMSNEINYEDLTRDPEFIQSFEKDPLRHTKVSPRLYTGMLDSFSQLEKFLPEIKIPTLVQISDSDPIIDSQEVQRLYQYLGSEHKKLILYKDNKHEVFNDLERLKAIKDQNQFLKPFILQDADVHTEATP